MYGRKVCVYSLARDGETKVSDHFKVKEFACSDGSDTVFISEDLIKVLENIRNHFESPVDVTSGYRTDYHNRRIGGAKYSQHKYGMAADIVVRGVCPKAVQNYIDEVWPDCYGMGISDNYTHIDVRHNRARWHY